MAPKRPSVINSVQEYTIHRFIFIHPVFRWKAVLKKRDENDGLQSTNTALRRYTEAVNPAADGNQMRRQSRGTREWWACPKETISVDGNDEVGQAESAFPTSGQSSSAGDLLTSVSCLGLKK